VAGRSDALPESPPVEPLGRSEWHGGRKPTGGGGLASTSVGCRLKEVSRAGDDGAIGPAALLAIERVYCSFFSSIGSFSLHSSHKTP